MKNGKIGFWVICITLTALLLVMVFPHTAYADSASDTYNTSENGINITGNEGADSSFLVPGNMDGQVGTISSTGETDTLVEATSSTGEANTSVEAGSNTGETGTSVEAGSSTGEAGTLVEAGSSIGETGTPVGAGDSTGASDASTEVYNPVMGITLDKTSAALMVGESLSLFPSINPAEAENKNIYWASSNTDAAIVDETGLIMAISEGTAIITATTEDGGYTATCEVHVCNELAVPGNELAAARNYNTIKVTWSNVKGASGYEVYRSDAMNGEYRKIAIVQAAEYSDTGLKVGTVYYYKVRAYEAIDDTTIYSDNTMAITAKTLDKNIGSSLFLYMSDLYNRNSVFQRAVVLHYGNPHNTCALTVSEALRRIKLNIPTSTCRTNQVEDYLAVRGWNREMNLNLLQPGDICFTTDVYGNFLGGHSTHTFIFMGWANKDKNLMNICDNQIYTYGSVLHTRTIYRSSLTDATAFFYHTNVEGVDSILKVKSAVNAYSLSYNKVKISWGAAPGAYGYKIYRATSKTGLYRDIATTRSTSFTNSYLTTGKVYYYKIRAYSRLGTSRIYGSYSSVYTATPKLSAPSAYGSSVSKGKAKLSWNGVSGASGYQIYRSAAKNGAYTHVGSTSSTSYANSGLVSGRDYYYKVRAYRYTARTLLYGVYSYVNLKSL